MKLEDQHNVKVQLCWQLLNTQGKTIIKAKKSRDHTEILFKQLKIQLN